MIRLMFVVFVCLAGFTAAALWSAPRDEAGTEAERFTPAAAAAAALTALADRAERELAEALPTRGEEDAGEPAASGSGGNGAAELAGQPSEPVPKRTAPVRASAPAAAAAADSADDPETATVRDLEPPAELARDLGGDLGDGSEPEPIALADAGWDDAPGAQAAGDPDASGDLIRRMLALYPRERERR